MKLEQTQLSKSQKEKTQKSQYNHKIPPTGNWMQFTFFKRPTIGLKQLAQLLPWSVYKMDVNLIYATSETRVSSFTDSSQMSRI